MTLQDILVEAATQLEKLSDSPRAEARLLISRATGRPVAWLLAHPETELSSAQVEAFNGLLKRRLSGEPLPYVLGHWEFFGLDFDLTPHVLIPRPETELLVETGIAWAQEHRAVRAIDVGTGCGCIGVTLAVHCPRLHVTATDISQLALEVAQRNAVRHGVQERLTPVKCDLFPAGDDPSQVFELIVSNPPYIPTETMRGLPVYGREPTLALDGGPDGLKIISQLLGEARRRLGSGGLMLVEIETSLGAAVLSLARVNFPAAGLEIRKDLLGLDRLLVVQN